MFGAIAQMFVIYLDVVLMLENHILALLLNVHNVSNVRKDFNSGL